jgi:hypothetical protein
VCQCAQEQGWRRPTREAGQPAQETEQEVQETERQLRRGTGQQLGRETERQPERGTAQQEVRETGCDKSVMFALTGRLAWGMCVQVGRLRQEHRP